MLGEALESPLWCDAASGREAQRQRGQVSMGSPVFRAISGEAPEGTDISCHVPILYGLAFLPSVRRVLEIGVASGYSTKALYAGLAHSGGGFLCSVDLVDCSQVLPVRDEGVEWRFVEGHSSLDRKRIEREIGEGPLDLVFLDGFHSFKQTVLDVSSYVTTERLRSGGIVVFHDSETMAGVHTAVAILEKRLGWPFVRVIDSNGLAIGQKP